MDRDEEVARFCAEAYPRLVAALGHHTGDPLLAEELAQEALVRAWDRWSRVRTYDAPVGWAFRVGANLASSHFRRRAAERRARERNGHASTVHHDPDTAEVLAVRAALATLTDQQRQAVVLRHVLGLSAGQAAAVLDTSPGAVRALTHRATTALRAVLEDGERRRPESQGVCDGA